MEVSALKSKVIMACDGQVSVRSLIVTGNTALEKANTLTYLGCNISHEEFRWL